MVRLSIDCYLPTGGNGEVPMQATESGIRQITYDRDSYHISLDDEDLALLGDIQERTLVPVDDGLHGYDVVREFSSFWNPNSRFPKPNLGFLQVLEYVAEQKGYSLEERRLSLATKVLTEPEELDCLEYPALAEFVNRHERGVIRVPSDGNIAALVADLMVAYPQQRFFILHKDVQPLTEIVRFLAEQFPDEAARGDIQLVHSGRRLAVPDDASFPKVICCPPVSAGSDLEFENADFVLILDASQCAQERYQIALEARDLRGRIFGITHPAVKPSPRESMNISAVFGFSVLDLMSAGRVRRDAQVAWVPHKGNEDSGRSGENLYSQNRYRNDVIARLAKSIFSGSGYYRNHRDVRRWIDHHPQNHRSVTIMVDRVEHAISLARKLPDWPVYAPQDCDLRGISRTLRQRLRGHHRWTQGTNQIVVAAAAKQFRGYLSDVLIWGSGGAGGVPLPESWLYSPDDPRRPFLLVDFFDKFDSKAEKWSEQRRSNYEQRDLFRVGMDAATGRIIRFLEQQRRLAQ